MIELIVGIFVVTAIVVGALWTVRYVDRREIREDIQLLREELDASDMGRQQSLEKHAHAVKKDMTQKVDKGHFADAVRSIENLITLVRTDVQEHLRLVREDITKNRGNNGKP